MKPGDETGKIVPRPIHKEKMPPLILARAHGTGFRPPKIAINARVVNDIGHFRRPRITAPLPATGPQPTVYQANPRITEYACVPSSLPPAPEHACGT